MFRKTNNTEKHTARATWWSCDGSIRRVCGWLAVMPNGFPEGLRGLSAESRTSRPSPRLGPTRRNRRIAALLAALLPCFSTCCSATNCMGGSIVYNIQNYPDLQNGFTLSGTITTDGTKGTD